MIEIQTLSFDNRAWIQEAASMLVEAFPHSWRSVEEGIEEVEECLEEEKIALAAVENGHAIGFIGAIPQYGKTGWEMHPLVILKSRRGEGVGSTLVKAIEKKIIQKGGIMIYLGSDDEFGTTNLSNCDLFENTFEKINNIRNLKNHPYQFYEKQGYKIVGVLPDANGIGKPDIWMAKRLIGR